MKDSWRKYLRRWWMTIGTVCWSFTAGAAEVSLVEATAPQGPASAAVTAYEKTPVPDWVVSHEIPPVSAATQKESVRYLLTDYQYRSLSGHDSAYYVHIVNQPMTEESLKTLGQIPLGFNPDYEKIELHALQYRRNGVLVDKLPSALIKVVQDEKQLQMGMYEGSSSLLIILDDLRMGDVVDLAYTIKGSNPIFAGRQFSTLRLQFSLPVELSTVRVVLPASLKVATRQFNGAPPVQQLTNKESVDYRWSAQQVPGIPGEDFTPGWFDPMMRVQISEFAGWVDVNQWALELFQITTPLSPALKAKIASLRQQSKTPEQAAVKAFRFVQDEVRYFGIEVGENSHKPHAPNEVFDLRYGDCKDKALLLVAMLRELGFEAAPALIASNSGRKLDEVLPSPGAFNHVITWARINGKVRWLDPTITLQRGDEAHLAFVNYDRALIVRPGTTSLTAMQSDGQITANVSVLDRIELGRDDSATLMVESRATGSHADNVRSRLASTSRDEFARGELNFVQNSYQGAASLRPIEVVDDELANVLTLRESYTLNHYIKRQASGDVIQLYANRVSEWVRLPHILERHTPMQVYAPFTLDEIVEVKMNSESSFSLSPARQINGAVINYQRESVQDKDVIRYRHHLAFTGDFVSPENADAHFTLLRDIQNSANVTLNLPAGKSAEREDRLKALLRGNGSHP